MFKRIHVILAGGVLFNILFSLYLSGFRPMDATLLRYLIWVNVPHAMAAISATWLYRFQSSLPVLNAGAILVVISDVLASVPSLLIEVPHWPGVMFLPIYQIPGLLFIIVLQVALAVVD
jgi:hypothetical protein